MVRIYARSLNAVSLKPERISQRKERKIALIIYFHDCRCSPDKRTLQKGLKFSGGVGETSGRGHGCCSNWRGWNEQWCKTHTPASTNINANRLLRTSECLVKQTWHTGQRTLNGWKAKTIADSSESSWQSNARLAKRSEALNSSLNCMYFSFVCNYLLATIYIYTSRYSLFSVEKFCNILPTHSHKKKKNNNNNGISYIE